MNGAMTWVVFTSAGAAVAVRMVSGANGVRVHTNRPRVLVFVSDECCAAAAGGEGPRLPCTSQPTPTFYCFMSGFFIRVSIPLGLPLSVSSKLRGETRDVEDTVSSCLT